MLQIGLAIRGDRVQHVAAMQPATGYHRQDLLHELTTGFTLRALAGFPPTHRLLCRYVKQVLVPQLRPGDIVIGDNLRPHQNSQVVQWMEAAGAKAEPAPSWRPFIYAARSTSVCESSRHVRRRPYTRASRRHSRSSVRKTSSAGFKPVACVEPKREMF